MALQAVPGSPIIPIGAGLTGTQTAPAASAVTMDAVNEAAIFVGYMMTSDGASHTIDTTGSSSLQWRTGAVTFANVGTTVKVGLAAVDTANGPPVRAVNVANVITFDVSKSMTGGGGGVTATAWQTHAPDAGTKTVANGDFIALCVQMTARGGVDSVEANFSSVNAAFHGVNVTAFTGGTFTASTGTPPAIVVFSDGALGYFYASEVFSTINTRTWNSGSAQKEYGQLFNLPFPTKIYGAYGWVDPDANYDVVLYSDPLGTPVAEKTVAVDLNTTSSAAARRFFIAFPAPYTYAANQNIVIALKPGASNISSYYRTLGNATHRIVDPWGTSGYGVQRVAAAFSNANSSLDHYYIGLLAGAFDAGGSAGRAIQVNNPSLVA